MRTVAFVALLGAGLLPAFGSGQTLYASSEQAGPGATISLTGDALLPTTRFTVTTYSAKGGPPVPIDVRPLSANGTVALITLPTRLPRGVYRITAANGKAPSNMVYVNRPRLQWSDVPEAMPGQTVRLVGRNFSPYGSAPKVTLTNATTNKAYAAPLLYTSDAALKIAVPALVPRGTYRIGINSGIAGSASSGLKGLMLTVRPRTPDPLGLGVAWCAELNSILAKVYNLRTDPRLPVHAVGDGRHDDAQAFAVALAWMSKHGGGTLYLPKGTYRVDDGTAWGVIYADTIVRGAGMGKTVLQVGYPYTRSNAAPEIHYAFGLAGSRAGIADLTVQNLNANAAPSGILFGTNQGTERIFFKRVDFQMGNSREIHFDAPNKAVVADCRFNSTGASLRISNARELQFLRNVEYHRTGRVAMNYGDRMVLEGNTVQFDNKYRNANSPETGGLELSFTQRVLLLKNVAGALGPAPNRTPGDGEVILTQYSQPAEFLYTGTVRSAQGTVLTPAEPFPTTAWQDARYPVPSSRMAVLIVAGRGVGQWRRATAWTAHSVTLDAAWQVVPNATSRFAVMPLNNFQHTYVGNRLFGGFYGIEWEDGAIDSTAEGNTLTDTGMLAITAYTADARNGQWGAAGSNYSFTAGWGNAILRNTLRNTTGARPATISIASIDLMNLNLGPLNLGNDVRDNTIVGHFTEPIAAQVGKTDGLEVISITPGHSFRVSDLLQQGTVLQDNTITNSNHKIANYFVGNGFLTNTATGGH